MGHLFSALPLSGLRGPHIFQVNVEAISTGLEAQTCHDVGMSQVLNNKHDGVHRFCLMTKKNVFFFFKKIETKGFLLI